MFSLIAVLVAIALAAALVILTVWYGGASYSSQASGLDGQALANQASQLRAAAQLYVQEQGVPPATVTDLVNGGYLSGDFTQGRWSMEAPYLTQSSVTQQQCAAFNAKLNVSGIPSCYDASVVGTLVCCAD